MAYDLGEGFGMRLKALRKEKKLFRFQLAAKVGCEAQLIKRLEKGYARTISSVQLNKICDVLGLSPETLLTETK